MGGHFNGDIYMNAKGMDKNFQAWLLPPAFPSAISEEMGNSWIAVPWRVGAFPFFSFF